MSDSLQHLVDELRHCAERIQEAAKLPDAAYGNIAEAIAKLKALFGKEHFELKWSYSYWSARDEKIEWELWNGHTWLKGDSLQDVFRKVVEILNPPPAEEAIADLHRLMTPPIAEPVNPV